MWQFLCVFTFQLKELEKKLEGARSKGFRPKIAEINRQIEVYTREKDKADAEMRQFKERQDELQAKLDKVDASLRALDPSADLSSFEDLCEYWLILLHVTHLVVASDSVAVQQRCRDYL